METVNIGYYFVAIIDIVGQRGKLKEWTRLPRNEAEMEKLVSDLVETAGFVSELRRQFDDMYATATQSTGRLDKLDAAQRSWIERRKQTNLWRRGFSDSYVMTAPCWYEAAPGMHAGDIYYSLLGICGMFIWALAMENPFRGGADIGLGTEIDTQEVYGPVVVQAYELEAKKAKWPRVLVGEGLLSYLDDLERRCGDDLDGRHTKINIKNCRSLITRSRGGNWILDVMGDGVYSVFSTEFTQIVQRGYEFVVKQEKRFIESGPKVLSRRYSQLRKYCESRLPVWKLHLIKD